MTEIKNESGNQNQIGNKHYARYKDVIKATTTKWMKDHKEEANRQYRERYKNDPELRERIKTRARERARRIKAEKLAQSQAK